MKRFKAWFFKTSVLAAYAFVALLAAAIAPAVARAQQCPTYYYQCRNGKIVSCPGTLIGHYCYYDRACINGGLCS
jgi:hypothetical protein